MTDERSERPHLRLDTAEPPAQDGTVTVIAEAGVNHNGSLELALALVDAAARTGADIVKFQTFTADRVATAKAPKATYQLEATDDAESQLATLRALELTEDMHRALIARCAERGIEFLSTPADEDSIELLATLGVKRIKVPSGEVINGPLLLRAARTGLPVILSTGMSDLDEVEAALGVLAFGYTAPTDAAPSRAAFRRCYESGAGRHAIRERVTLLHCTTEYPAPVASVNLRAIDTMASTFGTRVGYSDHTPGITVPIAAVARGACVIEKHMTLDRTLEGPDHKASLEPDEMAAMVAAIRDVTCALGTGEKTAANCEAGNRAIVRRSLVAALPIARGERFTTANLVAKRPGTGVSPMEYWRTLGRAARQGYAADDLIEASHPPV